MERNLPAALSLAILAVAGRIAGADVQFVKTQIDRNFRAEGVATADVDGDGKKDILAGPLWYQAPEWTPHEITTVKEFFPEKGYSESFCCFSDDLNHDGHPDLIVVGFPAAAVRIYENPGPGRFDRRWKETEAFPSCSNESPAFVDLTGDGRPEMVCGFQPENRMGWFAPGAQIGDSWEGHAFSGPNAPGGQQHSHGLGVGDVNLDGRSDVITPQGWYEAPADRAAPDWKFHAAPLGDACAHMYALDLDGDGDRDILSSSAHNYGIWWFEQGRSDGTAEWIRHEIEKSFSQTHSLMVADINQDGLPDFVTGKRWYAHQGHDPGGKEPAVLYWFELHRQDGKPSWTRHAIDSDSGVGTQFVLDDMNADGLADIVISNKKGVFYFEQRRAPAGG